MIYRRSRRNGRRKSWYMLICRRNRRGRWSNWKCRIATRKPYLIKSWGLRKLWGLNLKSALMKLRQRSIRYWLISLILRRASGWWIMLGLNISCLRNFKRIRRSQDMSKLTSSKGCRLLSLGLAQWLVRCSKPYSRWIWWLMKEESANPRWNIKMHHRTKRSTYCVKTYSSWKPS